MTKTPEELLSAIDLDAMVATMITRAKAGYMGHARLLLERDVKISESDMQAIVAAIVAKAATGNRAAIRLKRAIRGHRVG